MSLPTEPLPSSLLRYPSFALFWSARTATSAAYQMQAVAVGWQLYAMTGNALDLGIVGLVQFFPVVGLSLLIGHTVDRYDRRAVARVSQIIKALAALALAVGTASDWLGREAIFALVFVTGTARAFETPTMHALVPGIVPQQILPRAIAASATANQTAIICGPAIGGWFYAQFGPVAAYATCTGVFVTAAVLVSIVRTIYGKLDKRPVSLDTLFAGYGYIRKSPILLGLISLDLFVVLLGSVIALLPIYASDVLHTDASGLGLLRSAPAVGALAVSGILARYSIQRRAGHIMFASVAVFGIAIVVFSVSTSLLLSLVALVVYGAADAISVVVRHSLVQTRTPNEMLGRVMSVNSMFTGSSGTLGEFRAGAMAAAWGPVGAALVGGLGVVIVTVLWMRMFPQLMRIDTLVTER